MKRPESLTEVSLSTWLDNMQKEPITSTEWVWERQRIISAEALNLYYYIHRLERTNAALEFQLTELSKRT